MRFVVALGLIAAGAAPALAETVREPQPDVPLQRPRNLALPGHLPPGPAPLVVNSHILYLNNCRPSGCHVKTGSTTDSRTDTSDIATTGTLSALAANVDWNAVKTCITNVMAPFNIQVTDVDPGTADHFEVMIAGSPNQIGFDSSTGGVADYLCSGVPGQCPSTYLPNALVFDFAQVWGTNVNEICATAAQEIAHAWTLDHALDAHDPMTYNTVQSPLSFADGRVCGSDCLYSNGTKNAFGVTCSGTGYNGTHPCMETGQTTQNELQILKALFGPAGAQAPTVMLTSPANGSGVQTGTPFQVTATCSSGDGVQEIDLYIDGTLRGTMMTGSVTFTAPAQTAGMHVVKVLCASKLQATATAMANVVVGNLCATDIDCPGNGLCYQQGCIAGPGDPNGLGAACTGNGDCASTQCADDGQQMLCTVPCDLSNDVCPNGFSCLGFDDGTTNGVCWPGDGGKAGCCETGRGRANPLGAILLSLIVGALWITRRRGRIGLRT